ncbi:MAG: hypothetical protein RIQ50_99, partial [Bacteroidota bacterium]
MDLLNWVHTISTAMPPNPFELSTPYAIITGGCSGIGLSIAKLFHEQGAIVDVFDLQRPEEDQLEAWGLKNSTIAFHEIDITDQEKVKELVSIISIKRGIGILINNAGIA